MSEMHDDIEVTNCRTNEENKAKTYTVTILQLRRANTQGTHIVFHFWYLKWPDQGVPNDPTCMVEFVRDINRTRRLFLPSIWPNWVAKHDISRCGPPVVVHCSAGIGRTGTYCVLDINFARADDESRCDVMTTIRKIRRQRFGCVQTKEQYRFCHTALYYYVGHRAQFPPIRLVDESEQRGESQGNDNSATRTPGILDELTISVLKGRLDREAFDNDEQRNLALFIFECLSAPQNYRKVSACSRKSDAAGVKIRSTSRDSRR
jgi:hypothetical protein